MLTPHEPQALRNHSQTLQRLAERGGLALNEIVYILRGLRWSQTDISDEDALPIVLAAIIEFEKKEGNEKL